MANKQNIPPNDPDLILAQRIGNALPQLDALRHDDDPLLSRLMQFKQAESQTSTLPDSEKIWDSIEGKIKADESPAVKIFRLNPAVKRYAIAAALLITAFTGLMVYQNLSGPDLIGESLASIQHIELPDGSAVTLRPYSKLYEDTANEHRQEYSLEGEAYFEVEPSTNRVFSVKTSRSEVQVLGTKFILSEWGNTSSVFLEEGRIRYEALGSRENVVLNPGQSSRIDDSTVKPAALEADKEVFKDWLNSELIFQNESANLVFQELEQHFNIHIESEDSMEQKELSGSLQLDDLPSVLKNLELVLDGQFTQTGENSYAFNLNR